MDFVIHKYGLVGQFVLFIFAEHLTIGLKLVLDKLSNTIPQDIEIQKERQRFVIDAMMDEARYVTCRYRKNNEYTPEKVENEDERGEHQTRRGRTDQREKKSGARSKSITRKNSLAPTFRTRRKSKEPLYNDSHHSLNIEKSK